MVDIMTEAAIIDALRRLCAQDASEVLHMIRDGVAWGRIEERCRALREGPPTPVHPAVPARHRVCIFACKHPECVEEKARRAREGGL